MVIERYVATVFEIDGNGNFFSCIYHSDSPEGLLKQVLHHLQMEIDERDISLSYDKAALLDDLQGNELSGPFRIESEDDGAEFIIAAKKICIPVSVTLPVDLHVLSLTQGYGNCALTDAIPFGTVEEARNRLREEYQKQRAEGGRFDRSVFPDGKLNAGMPLDRYVTEDQVNIWNEYRSFRGNIQKRTATIKI